MGIVKHRKQRKRLLRVVMEDVVSVAVGEIPENWRVANVDKKGRRTNGVIEGQ